MLVSQIGEREIIKLLAKTFGIPSRMCVPFGDDVSGVDLGGGKLAILKVDMLVGKTDVPSGMGFRQVGWKAMVMSVSDFFAKGVKPTAALISLGLPSTMKKEDVQEIALGLRKASLKYDVKILGGDTNEASDIVIASILFGVCQKKDLIMRRGAKPGDIVVVSGRFGNTGSGLKVLFEKIEAPPQLKRKLLRSVYMPEARMDFGLNLKNLGATSAIDSSDGLAWSLHELSKASNVGFILTRLPVSKETDVFAKINELDPFDLTFYGGEEYEIVATLNPKKYGEKKRSLKEEVLVVGEAVKEKKIVYIEDGKERKIEAKGWEHFQFKM